MLKRWSRSRALALVLAAVVALGLVAVWRMTGDESLHQEAARRGLQQVFGARITIEGPVTLRYLPRPHVTMANISGEGPAGTGTIHIPLLKGTIGLLPLLRGEIVFSRIQLIELSASVDADALVAARDADPTPASVAQSLLRNLPEKLVITAGLIEIRSIHPALRGLMTDLNTMVEGLDRSGFATLSGRAMWHGERGEFSARVDSASAFVDGQATSGSLKLKSAAASLSVTGTMSAGWRGGFTGTVATSTPSLPRLLRLAGFPVGPLAAIRHASFSGTGEGTENGIAFSDTRLMLNDTAFEGTLAVQNSHGRFGLAGTLATDLLDLTPLLDIVPPIRKDDGTWNDAAMTFDPGVLRDFDLRISANKAKLGAIEAEDAAISALCRGGRMEIALGEARTFDGLIKGRAVASVAADGLDLKLDMSVSRINLEHVSDMLPAGSGHYAGSTTGHISAEARGRTMQGIVESLSGRGQLSVRLGTVSGAPAFDALLQSGGQSFGNKPFDLATASLRVERGLATLDQGTIVGPDLQFAVTGHAFLPRQTYDVLAAPAPLDGGDTLDAAPPTNIVGTWGGAFHVRDTRKTGLKAWGAPPTVAPAEFFP